MVFGGNLMDPRTWNNRAVEYLTEYGQAQVHLTVIRVSKPPYDFFTIYIVVVTCKIYNSEFFV